MKIDAFKIERYFAKYELTAKYLLSNSDCDGYPLSYLLERLDGEEKKLWDTLTLNYTEPQGLPQLRARIAKQYQTIEADNVVVLSPGEANFAFMNAVLEEGDHIICMAPAYQSLYQVATSLGCEISFWQPQKTTWTFQLDDLKALVNKKTKALVVNFPHNPTGYLPTKMEMYALAEFARTHQLTVWSDEIYHQLVYEEKDAIPAFCDLYENAVSLWGLSKSFGLSGLRLGWIATRNQKLLEEMLGFKDYLTMCNNALSEILAMMVLKKKEEFLQPNLIKIKKNLNLFNQFCSKHQDFLEFVKPLAGSTAFIKLKIEESTFDYCHKLREETGIMLLPSEVLGYESGYVRVGFGQENMPNVLEKWDAYILKKIT